METGKTPETDANDLDDSGDFRPIIRISVRIGSPQQGQIVRAFATLLRFSEEKRGLAEAISMLMAGIASPTSSDSNAEIVRPLTPPGRSLSAPQNSAPPEPDKPEPDKPIPGQNAFERRRARRMSESDIVQHRIEIASDK
jgi:hypothetical protein